MKRIYSDMTELIGETPLLMLSNYGKRFGLKAVLLGKLEYFNPAGSVKDRVAKAMINDAEDSGLLEKDSVIIEPTSGNTGIGLAAVAASKGYKIVLTMPETMSAERRSLLRAYGAEIVLTEGGKGMQGAIDKAEELAAAIPGSIILGQFTNPSNPAAHRIGTGPEIWRDTEGEVDILVAGIGTGGTITGAGEFLKSQKDGLRVIGIEPKDSPILSQGKKGSHKLQGIGAGFIPEVLNTGVYDDIIAVTAEDAYAAANALTREEGVLVGISSGAALWAATDLAKNPENKDKTIVVILPDTGERYLSTSLFE